MEKSMLRLSRVSFKRISCCVLLILAAASFFATNAYYTTSGQNIVDRQTRTQVTILKGVGIGGWLEPEGYMWGSGQYDSPRKIEKAISDLIGQAAADSFWILYHWNFFNEDDVKACKGWGMNAIRIPLAAGVIQRRDSQPSAPPYKYVPEGWRILDSLVTWCERWQLGIIWDMHCAPGSQNGQNISDVDPSVNRATLWSDTATFWPRTRDIWFKIADRYKGYKCVIGYDLLNEPLLTNIGFNGSLLRKLYVELTDTIRKVDTVGIMFVEGQWWARDFTIMEPLNWDKHLVAAFHEYPPVISCATMSGSSGGGSWNHCALRTKYNIPLWHGETGEQGGDYSRNIQSTDFLLANNIGWAWWNEKKFDNQNAPLDCPKTSGFKSVLSYWNGGAKPSAADAKNWLFDQARRTALSYCTVDQAMLRSIKLDPNGKVPVMQTFVPKQEIAGFLSEKAGKLAVEFAVAQRFSVEMLDISGRSVFRATVSGKKLEIPGRLFSAGSYVLRAVGEKTSLQPRIVVLHP
jgi:endoglucanase